MRSGAYNTYWIAGGAKKLGDDLAEELREAVNRGDGLIVDGMHDERNKALDAVAGVAYKGKLSPGNQPIRLTGDLYAGIATEPLATLGRSLMLELTSGQAQALFAASNAANAANAAIVSNQYGLGHALLFAYDWVGTLMAQSTSSVQAGIVSASTGWTTPATPATFTAGDYALVRTRVENVGQAVEVRVTLALPAGAVYVGASPAATPDAQGRPVWTANIAVGASVDLVAAIRLPMSSGAFTAQAALESIRNGQTTLYNTYSFELAVAGADTLGNQVLAALQGLAVSNKDKSNREHAVEQVQAALAKLAQGQYDEAIEALLEAVEDLLKIASADVSAIRLQVDRLLDEAAYRWYLAQLH